jgi:UDP-N-acetylmuramoyl-L-alanyl-D-glutamate--2,6-diaminopimelate ligase
VKTLSDILAEVEIKQQSGNMDIPVREIIFDSRKAVPGCLFIAVRGTRTDGHQYISQAIDRGAVAVVCEQLPENPDHRIGYVVVENSAETLGLAASAFYSHPSSRIRLVGVTGTNGKTTTVTLLYNLVRKLGFKAGLLSTVRNYIDHQVMDATHTTPDAIQINQLLDQMVQAGCTFCFMEVSSHAIDQRRIAGLDFAGAVFTNITHDHLDYHKTFAEYIKAKKMFFDGLKPGSFALINTDDKNGRVMVQNTQADIRSYGIRAAADFKAKIIENHFEGSLLRIGNTDVWTYFVGTFNAYNLLSVYATSSMLGLDQTEILTTLSQMKPVEGRFETIRSQQGVTAIVDYAHTPDALMNVLRAINQIRKKEQDLITVVGAGGDRDKTKRPQMAKIAASHSSKVILTSDNPRTEDPNRIIEEMKAGLKKEDHIKTIAISDRKEAIRTACLMAKNKDIILVAGKGHETYQEINGVKHHFDDREVIQQTFNEIYN